AGARGRLGYLITPSVMVFGTLGVAFQHVEVTLNCVTNGACGANGVPAFSSSASTTMAGPSVGGGVEVKLGGNWSARGEYRFADYGTWRPTFGSTAALGVSSAINMQTHTALFGLSYTFAVPR